MSKDDVRAEHVIQVVCDAFKEGESKYGVKARIILCCIIGMPPEIAQDVLQLCQRFKDQGVVGIDIAGDEATIVGDMYNDQEKQVFAEARRLGIHRTVHAGEDGPSDHVTAALGKLNSRLNFSIRELIFTNLIEVLEKGEASESQLRRLTVDIWEGIDRSPIHK